MQAVVALPGASAPAVAMRRSSRVSVAIAVRVRSLDGSVRYAEKCQTLVVNAHGCGFRSPRPLPVGTRVEVEGVTSQRRGNGRTVNCAALPPNSWLIGVQLDVPGNIWGLHPVPADWPADTANAQDAAGADAAPSGAKTAGLSYSPFASSPPPGEHHVPPTAAAAPAAEEKAALQSSLDDRARQLTAGLTREAERSMAALRQFVEERTRRDAETIGSALAESKAEISRCAETASRDAAADLQQRMAAEFERELQQLHQAGKVLHGEAQQIEQERRTLAAEIETVRAERGQLEAMLRQLPETIRGQAEDRAAALLGQMRARMQEDAAAALDGRLHSAMAALHKAGEEVQEQLERTLSEHFQERNEATQAAYDSALQRLQQLHTNTQNLVSTVHSELNAKVTEAVREALQESVKQGRDEFVQSATAIRDAHVAELRAEVDRLVSEAVSRGEQGARQVQDAVARLEQQQQAAQDVVESIKQAQEELSQSAAVREAQAAQLQADWERLLAGAAEQSQQIARQSQELIQGLDRQKQAADEAARHAIQRTADEIAAAAAATRETHIAQIRAEVDRLFAGAVERSEAAARQLQELLAAVEQQRRTVDDTVKEIVTRAQEGLSQSAAADRQAQVAQIQEELDRLLAGAVARGEHAARQLRELMEGLRRQNQAGEATVAALGQEIERSQGWLAEETRKFKQGVHDAFVEAGGEIKGRMHAAIEAADGPIQRRAHELQARVEQAAAAKRAELQHQVEESRTLLLAAAAEAEKTSDELLKQRLAQTLQAFQQDADKLARSSLERWQSVLQESWKVIPEALQRALDKEK